MIVVETLPSPPVEEKEILRYASAKAGDPATAALMTECLYEIADRLCYRVCFARFPIERHGGEIRFAGITTASQTLHSALSDCDELLLFAATVGVEIDRAVERYGRVSPAKGLMMQAIGAERIESLCNAFSARYQDTLSAENLSLKPRVSPGYGDLPLTIQKNIFSILDCPRKIGLTLNDSLLMTPTKSVTAIAGITRGLPGKKENCEDCQKENCVFRRKGEGLCLSKST